MSLFPINLHPASQFYRFLFEEKLCTEKDEQRNEVQSYIHYESALLNDNKHWKLHLETFRRKQRSSILSQSEKDFFQHISFADSDIHLISDANNLIKKIENVGGIQQKLNERIERLSKYYTGRHADLSFLLWRKKYEKEDRLMNRYMHYEFFGLFLIPYLVPDKSRIVRYILPDTQVKVEEIFTVEELSENEWRINIQAKGCESSNPNVEPPIIDQYSGFYLINNHTGLIKESQVQVQFSSKEYLKKINYQLKSIKHEEI